MIKKLYIKYLEWRSWRLVKKILKQNHKPVWPKQEEKSWYI